MKKVLFTITMLSLSIVLLAGSKTKSGTAGAQELLVPVGAKMIGLNGGAISTVSGIEALYWNPAGVSGMEKNSEVTFFNGDHIGDISQNYFAGAVNFGEIGVFSFSLRSFDFGDIAVTSEEQPDGTGATYSPSFITTSMGYSNALTDRIKVGFSLNVISEKIIRTEATGVAFDAGIQYNNLANINGLSFGIVLKNLGPKMKFDGPDLLQNANEIGSSKPASLMKRDGATFELPSLFQIGVGYTTGIDELNNLSLSGVFEQNNTSTDAFKGSIEYSFNDMLFLRGSYGMNQSLESEENLFGTAFGAGIKYDMTYFVLNVDYAYRDSQYFDGLHNIGITIGL